MRRKRQGGKRPGAGRPMADTVELRTAVKRETLGKIERLARLWGFRKTTGGGAPFYGSALDRIMTEIDAPEPEYVRIAREAREEQAQKAHKQ